MNTPPTVHVLHNDWDAYCLLDSGNRQKLERFGDYVVVRSEPKAWWKPALPERDWKKAVATHKEAGGWQFSPKAPRTWQLNYGDTLRFEARLTEGSKHLGVFSEQSAHWKWIEALGKKTRGEPKKALNLFGYTGAATLVAAKAGFAVTHVDASRPAISWARHNQTLSGLGNAPIRWILDDALKFLRREVRRGNRYDLVMLDPPSFGRGPSGEVWKVEVMLPELLELCRQVFSEQPLAMIMTLYSLEASPIMLGNLLRQTTEGLKGEVSIGELALKPEAPEIPAQPNWLPLSLWARWENGV